MLIINDASHVGVPICLLQWVCRKASLRTSFEVYGWFVPVNRRLLAIATWLSLCTCAIQAESDPATLLDQLAVHTTPSGLTTWDLNWKKI